MLKSVLVINGAVRSNGNTDILASKLLEGSRNTGLDIGLIELRKKEIANCIGCYHCVTNSMCVLNDDMTEIRNDITSTADLLNEFYKRLWDRLEVNLVETVHCGGIMEKRSVLERPEYLEQAYALGRNLGTVS
jgi:hypothetical protein